MPINKEELSKLSPEERIKRLKQLEEERKKEVDEIEELIKKSMQELRTGKLAEEITPEQRPVDIARLFGPSEQGLERTAREAMPAAPFVKGTKAYRALVETYQAYTQLQKLDRALAMYGTLSEEQRIFVGEIGERLNRAEKYMTEGEKAASKLDVSRAVLYKLRKDTGIE